MLWTGLGRIGWHADPWAQFRRLRRDLDALFSADNGRGAGDYPAVNVWHADDDIVVTAEMPGIDRKDIDVSVVGNTLTIRGSRQPDELDDTDTCHRCERGYGQFARTVQLPYDVDMDRVEATYQKGALRLTLPRAEASRPKKITVAGA